MKKLSVTVRAVFTFALIVVAVMLAVVWAEPLSGGNRGLWLAFIFIAVLYLIAGLPDFIESMMMIMEKRSE